MELWEMSDGRIWKIDRSRGTEIYVSTLLDNGHASAIGFFANDAEALLFAQNYLRITVTYKVREGD